MRTAQQRAAILLFHEDPERLITGAFVKIGFFRTDSDLLYQDEVHGDLLGQVEKTLDLLLTKYLRAGISYEGLQRVETFPVPEAALREAVINAIAHKDYASRIPIQISMYPDKLMIWNSGHLPQHWTLDNLTHKHASCPFNPDVANVFFKAAYLESWGRGIELMRNACASQGAPDPVFRWDNGLWVEFPFAVPASPAQSSGVSATQEITQETTQEKIIALLRQRPKLTRRDLAGKLGITDNGVKYHLNKLKAAGAIRHVGSTKAGHWEVLK